MCNGTICTRERSFFGCVTTDDLLIYLWVLSFWFHLLCVLLRLHVSPSFIDAGKYFCARDPQRDETLNILITACNPRRAEKHTKGCGGDNWNNCFIEDKNHTQVCACHLLAVSGRCGKFSFDFLAKNCSIKDLYVI